MITVFNRKELTITFDMNEQARVRSLLAAEGIDYYVKTVNRMSPSLGARGRMGAFGQSQDTTLEYVIYVKRDDYEKALHLIQR